MTSEKIEKLREMTKSGDVFHEMEKYFFDNFVNHTDFINAGKRCQDAHLSAALEALVDQISLGKKADKIEKLLIIKYLDSDMLHGTVMTKNSTLIMFYYFENEKFGLATILPTPLRKETLYTRFSTALTIEDSFWAKQTKDISLN